MLAYDGKYDRSVASSAELSLNGLVIPGAFAKSGVRKEGLWSCRNCDEQV